MFVIPIVKKKEVFVPVASRVFVHGHTNTHPHAVRPIGDHSKTNKAS